jgi:hypothetical protein
MRREWVQCVVAAIDGFLIREERSCLWEMAVHNSSTTMSNNVTWAPMWRSASDPAVPSLAFFACRNI